MSRRFIPSFADMLVSYRSANLLADPRQAELAAEHALFLSTDPSAFERSNPVGHFTGSAVVLDEARGRILLTHHAKMLKWLQLGGHCDGIRDPFFVALKEAYEEGGLKHIRPGPLDIFDLSVHEIPQHGAVPPHLHYDVRFLFFADSSEEFVRSEESLDLAWVTLGSVADYSDARGLLRMEKKAIQFLEHTTDYRRPSDYVEPPLFGAAA